MWHNMSVDVGLPHAAVYTALVQILEKASYYFGNEKECVRHQHYSRGSSELLAQETSNDPTQ